MRWPKSGGWIGIGLAAVLGLGGCGGSSSPPKPATTSTTPTETAPHTVATGTSTTSPGGTTTSPGPSGGPVPAGTEASSITFISPATALVLGTAPCDVQPCSAILRTSDRGAHWVGLPAPRENVSYYLGDGLWGLRFADAQHGYAFGHGLWETSNGGRSWVKARPPAPTILSVEAVQDRELVALAQTCAPGQGCHGKLGLYHAPIGGAWSQVTSVRTSSSAASIAVHGSTVWVMAGSGLLYSSDGGQSFRSEAQPCPTRGSSFGQPTSITDAGSHVYLLCTGQGFTGHTLKFVYATTGPSASWRLTGRPPSLGDGGQISAGSDASILIASYSAASLLYRSTDGGHTWKTALTRDDGGAGWSDLGFTTSTDAVVVHGPAVAGSQRPGQVLLSEDGGRTWHTAGF